MEDYTTPWVLLAAKEVYKERGFALEQWLNIAAYFLENCQVNTNLKNGEETDDKLLLIS